MLCFCVIRWQPRKEPVADPQAQARAQHTNLPPRVIQAQRFLAQRGWTPGHGLPARASGARRRASREEWRRSDRGRYRSHRHLATPWTRQPFRLRRSAWSPAASPQSLSTPQTRPAIAFTWEQPAVECGWRRMRAPPTHLQWFLRRLPIRWRPLSGASGCFHQHWRTDGSAGRHGRDSGRNRRPQRRARLLLWCRHSAFNRRWKLLEPDFQNQRCGAGPRSSGLQFRRRRICRLCLEHGQSASWWWRRFRRPTKARWSMRSNPATATRVCITPPTAARRGIWPPLLMAVAIDVQGPLAAFATPDGNAATSVVWNPVRQLFVAAVRFHGYYQSTDGVTWTRMTAQPGTGLSTLILPKQSGQHGFDRLPHLSRHAGGESFTGRHVCLDGGLETIRIRVSGRISATSSGGTCSNQTHDIRDNVEHGGARDEHRRMGPRPSPNGSYNLALAAVPAGLGAGQDTLLLAGANDLWKCSLAMGCVWRNTTNSTTCKSAQVGEFQHALALESRPIRWRSSSATTADSGARPTRLVKAGQVCSADDSSHFQNLNGGLGSLAEVVSLSAITSSPYTMMAGLGVNGTAGVKSSCGRCRLAADSWRATAARWPSTPPTAANWYVNNQSGSLHLPVRAIGGLHGGGLRDQSGGQRRGCGRRRRHHADAGAISGRSARSVAVAGRNLPGVARTGRRKRLERRPMPSAPFSTTGSATGACSGDALIRSMAATGVAGRRGASLRGHVRLRQRRRKSGRPCAERNRQPGIEHVAGLAGSDPRARWPMIADSLNKFGMDISSIFIDPHDATGNTVYITVAGASELVRGGAGGLPHDRRWSALGESHRQPPRYACQQHCGRSAGREYGLHRNGRGSLFYNRRSAAAPCPSPTAGRCLGPDCPLRPLLRSAPRPLAQASPRSGGGNLRPWHLADSAVDSGYKPYRGCRQPSHAFLCQPDVRDHKQRPDRSTLTNTGSNTLTVTAISMSGDFGETDNCRQYDCRAGDELQQSRCRLHPTRPESAPAR